MRLVENHNRQALLFRLFRVPFSRRLLGGVGRGDGAWCCFRRVGHEPHAVDVTYISDSTWNASAFCAKLAKLIGSAPVGFTGFPSPEQLFGSHADVTSWTLERVPARTSCCRPRQWTLLSAGTLLREPAFHPECLFTVSPPDPNDPRSPGCLWRRRHQGRLRYSAGSLERS